MLLGWSNGQRELNPFLFQAELPLPFWPLLFWLLVWIHENGRRSCVAAWTKDDFKFLETNVESIYLFSGELWHTAQPILINVLCTIQYAFVLVNKCSSQVNCEYYSFFHYYVCHRCVTHTQSPYSSQGKIFSKTLLIIVFRHPQMQQMLYTRWFTKQQSLRTYLLTLFSCSFQTIEMFVFTWDKL